MTGGNAGPDFIWTRDEIRRVGHRVVEMIADHLTTIDSGPVFAPVSASHAQAIMCAESPVSGKAPDAVLDAFAREVLGHPFGNGHAQFHGWVNSPPAVMSVFGAALAAAMNPSVAGGNHAAVWLEHQVIAVFRRMLGMPDDAAGLLVSGGSAAAIVALGAARQRACVRMGWDVRERGVPRSDDGACVRLVVYRSREGHGCNQKAVELLGLGSAALREVPVDTALRMQPDALDAMIEADLARGLVPMAVVASAGTVNTGAIDPLDAIADVCARHDVWLHVDGAYGAPAILTAAYAGALSPIGRADSVAVDAHKWMYVAVDAGVVLVRDAALLRDTFSLVPAYLRVDGNAEGVQGPPWFSEFGIEQTRSFRALKVWMALQEFGLDGYAAMIARDIAHAEKLAGALRADPMFEIREPQSLSIVCFRVVPDSERGDAAAVDALNRRVLLAVQLGGEAFLSGTVLDNNFWLRACFVNPRTQPRNISALVNIVKQAASLTS